MTSGHNNKTAINQITNPGNTSSGNSSQKDPTKSKYNYTPGNQSKNKKFAPKTPALCRYCNIDIHVDRFSTCT